MNKINKIDCVIMKDKNAPYKNRKAQMFFKNIALKMIAAVIYISNITDFGTI